MCEGRAVFIWRRVCPQHAGSGVEPRLRRFARIFHGSRSRFVHLPKLAGKYGC
nr:MAG TPA: hypothetical protein [Caudoviricetes sp.]